VPTIARAAPPHAPAREILWAANQMTGSCSTGDIQTRIDTSPGGPPAMATRTSVLPITVPSVPDTRISSHKRGVKTTDAPRLPLRHEPRSEHDESQRADDGADRRARPRAERAIENGICNQDADGRAEQTEADPCQQSSVDLFPRVTLPGSGAERDGEGHPGHDQRGTYDSRRTESLVVDDGAPDGGDGAFNANRMPVRRGPIRANAAKSSASPIARPTNPQIASGSQSGAVTVDQPRARNAIATNAAET